MSEFAENVCYLFHIYICEWDATHKCGMRSDTLRSLWPVALCDCTARCFYFENVGLRVVEVFGSMVDVGRWPTADR